VPSPDFDLDLVRARIPLLRHAIPMNNCSQAPQSDATRVAAESFLASWNEQGMDWTRWMDEVDLSRREFARLIGAPPETVAAVTSVSHATAAIASACDFRSSRNVVLASGAEFPTVGHVWLAHEAAGAVVRWVPVRSGAVELDDYERLIDERTLLVSAAHAYYLNGFVQDVATIARLAHARGALLFVDAYQSLGTAPVDVRALDVDFLASGTLKFLMGTPGIAFLYVRPELIDRLHPRFTGWFGRGNPFAFDARTLDWSPTASRFETGTPAIFSAYVSRAGMAMLQDVGMESVGAWNGVLSHRLVEEGLARGLRLHGPGTALGKTPTTAFVVPGDSHDVEQRLRQRGVIASARGQVIRLAPHFYSSIEDVDRALDALAAEVRP
jgi:selenocysteine lyase/cysteine desulfurase